VTEKHLSSKASKVINDFSLKPAFSEKEINTNRGLIISFCPV
jgi:hypothetical protein